MSRLALVLGVAVIAVGCATIDRVNTSSTGTAANADAAGVVVSGSSRFVAFGSAATNLVLGSTDGLVHVYRKDRLTRTTIRVDLAASGALSPRASSVLAMNNAGNLVAFTTDAQLVPADHNTASDLYVRDIDGGTTTLASLMPDGSQIPTTYPSGVSEAHFDSKNRLLFEVYMGVIPPRDRLELRDLAAGTTVEVLGDSEITTFTFSRDGNHVVYNTGCFQAGGCFPTPHIIDLANPYPNQPSGLCSGVKVGGQSDNGRYVVYNGGGTVGPGCNGLHPHRYDRKTGEWLDVDFAPTAGLGVPGTAGLSGDGRFVLMEGADTALSGGTAGFLGLFVFDAVGGVGGRISADAFDRAANASMGTGGVPAISRDGRTAVFTIAATNLVAGDTNGKVDAFARALPRPRISSAAPSSLARGANRVTVTVSGDEFVPQVIASFLGAGVTVHSATPSANGHTLTLNVSVALGAAIGARTLIVTNLGGFGRVQSLCVGCLTVT